MPGRNAVLNSSFEFGDGFLHGDGSLPTSWSKYESLPTLLYYASRIDYRPSLHGIAAVYLQDSWILASGQSIGLSQTCPVIAGVGSQHCLSVDFEGFTNTLDAALSMIYKDAGGAIIGYNSAFYTNAQLIALGSLQGPVRLSVVGTVIAGTVNVELRIGYAKTTAGATAGAATAQGTWDKVQYEYASAPTPYSPADGYQGGGAGNGPKDIPFVYTSGEYLLTAASPLLSIKFNDHNIANEGYDLIVEKVEGLHSLPDIKVLGDYEDNAYHGGFAGVEHFSARVITIDFVLRATSEALFYKRLTAIKKALTPDGTDRKLWFRRNGIAGMSKKFINVRVRRFGGFASTFDSTSGIGRGSVQLIAHDPAIYDAVSSKASVAPGAGVTAPTPFPGLNFTALAGSFRTYPVVTITGPVTNPHIGRSYGGVISAEENYVGDFILTAAIPAGQSVTVDFKNRTVTHSSGADWSQYVDPASKWWAMSPFPGATLYVEVHANPNAAGFSAAIEWWPAWL